MSILDNFDVVGVPRTFSIAEVRILKNRISFNLATASEIGYPPFVRLFISRDKNADCVAALCQRNAERDEVLYVGFYERRKAQEEDDSGWKSCADGTCKSRYWCRDECSVKGAGCSLRR